MPPKFYDRKKYKYRVPPQVFAERVHTLIGEMKEHEWTEDNMRRWESRFHGPAVRAAKDYILSKREEIEEIRSKRREEDERDNAEIRAVEAELAVERNKRKALEEMKLQLEREKLAREKMEVDLEIEQRKREREHAEVLESEDITKKQKTVDGMETVYEPDNASANSNSNDEVFHDAMDEDYQKSQPIPVPTPNLTVTESATVIDDKMSEYNANKRLPGSSVEEARWNDANEYVFDPEATFFRGGFTFKEPMTKPQPEPEHRGPEPGQEKITAPDAVFGDGGLDKTESTAITTVNESEDKPQPQPQPQTKPQHEVYEDDDQDHSKDVNVRKNKHYPVKDEDQDENENEEKEATVMIGKHQKLHDAVQDLRAYHEINKPKPESKSESKSKPKSKSKSKSNEPVDENLEEKTEDGEGNANKRSSEETSSKDANANDNDNKFVFDPEAKVNDGGFVYKEPQSQPQPQLRHEDRPFFYLPRNDPSMSYRENIHRLAMERELMNSDYEAEMRFHEQTGNRRGMALTRRDNYRMNELFRDLIHEITQQELDLELLHNSHHDITQQEAEGANASNVTPHAVPVSSVESAAPAAAVAVPMGHYDQLQQERWDQVLRELQQLREATQIQPNSTPPAMVLHPLTDAAGALSERLQQSQSQSQQQEQQPMNPLEEFNALQDLEISPSVREYNNFQYFTNNVPPYVSLLDEGNEALRDDVIRLMNGADPTHLGTLNPNGFQFTPEGAAELRHRWSVNPYIRSNAWMNIELPFLPARPSAAQNQSQADNQQYLHFPQNESRSEHGPAPPISVVNPEQAHITQEHHQHQHEHHQHQHEHHHYHQHHHPPQNQNQNQILDRGAEIMSQFDDLIASLQHTLDGYRNDNDNGNENDNENVAAAPVPPDQSEAYRQAIERDNQLNDLNDVRDALRDMTTQFGFRVPNPDGSVTEESEGSEVSDNSEMSHWDYFDDYERVNFVLRQLMQYESFKDTGMGRAIQQKAPDFDFKQQYTPDLAKQLLSNKPGKFSGQKSKRFWRNAVLCFTKLARLSSSSPLQGENSGQNGPPLPNPIPMKTVCGDFPTSSPYDLKIDASNFTVELAGFLAGRPVPQLPYIPMRKHVKACRYYFSQIHYQKLRSQTAYTLPFQPKVFLQNPQQIIQTIRKQYGPVLDSFDNAQLPVLKEKDKNDQKEALELQMLAKAYEEYTLETDCTYRKLITPEVPDLTAGTDPDTVDKVYRQTQNQNQNQNSGGGGGGGGGSGSGGCGSDVNLGDAERGGDQSQVGLENRPDDLPFFSNGSKVGKDDFLSTLSKPFRENTENEEDTIYL